MEIHILLRVEGCLQGDGVDMNGGSPGGGGSYKDQLLSECVRYTANVCRFDFKLLQGYQWIDA